MPHYAADRRLRMKKVFEKIFAVILSFVLISGISPFSVYAVEAKADMSNIIELCYAWGITAGTNISENIMEENAAPEEVSRIFENLGALTPTFSGSIVRQNAVLEAVVNMLGYESVAERRGGYYSVATELGLLKGIKPPTAEAAVYRYILTLLYNAMDADVLKIDYNDNNNVTLSGGGSFLEEKLNIYHAFGVVTANGRYAIEAKDRQIDGFAKIDSETYHKNGVSLDGLLGCEVEFYYKKDAQSYGEASELLYAKLKYDDRRIIIDASDIEAYSNKSYTYYLNDKLKSAKFAADATVIYNSMPASSYTDDMMKPKSGSVILIDSDGDGKYEVVNVTSYTYIMAGSVDTYNKKIYDRSNSSLSLDYSDNTSFVMPDGSAAEIASVKLNTVLSVMHNDEETKVIITNDIVTGQVSSIKYGDDISVLINGVPYEFSSGFYGDTPKPGDYAVFYLDHNSDIYYYETENKDISYAYVTKLVYVSEDDEYIMLRLFTPGGGLSNYRLAEKVKIDGIMCRTAEEQRNMLTDENKNTKYQLITFKTDDDGNLKSIDTPYNNRNNPDALPNEKEGENSLHMLYSCYAGGTKNRQVANHVGGRYFIIGGKTILSASTVYLSIPGEDEIEEATDDDFGVTSIWKIEDDKLCDLEAYTIGDSLLATVAIKQEKAVKSIEGGNYAAIVTDVGEAWREEDGEVVQSIKAIKGGREFSLWTEPDKEFPTGDGNSMCRIKYGDVIRVNASAYTNGEIKTAEVLARIENGKPVYTDDSTRMESVKNEAIGDFTAESQAIFASVLKKEGNILKILPEKTMDGQNTDPYLNALSSSDCAIYVCDTKKRSVSVGGIDDIVTHEQSDTEYSRLFIYTAWCNIHMIVIYK